MTNKPRTLLGIIAIVVLAALANGVKHTPSAAPKTLEQTAADTCVWQGSSVRELVKASKQTGFSTDDIQAIEFAGCIGREKAVLEEEVRRGLRPAFAPDAPKASKAATEMPCPPSHWMTSNGCQKVLTEGSLSR